MRPPVPLAPAAPTQPVMVSDAAVTLQDDALGLPENVRVCAPEPRAMVLMVLICKTPKVSEKPLVAPVLKLPPFKSRVVASGSTLEAPSWRTPPETVVVPV